MIGGNDGSNPLDSVIYAKINTDGSLGTWTTTQSLVNVCYYHTSVVYDDYIYVAGGIGTLGYLDSVQYARFVE